MRSNSKGAESLRDHGVLAGVRDNEAGFASFDVRRNVVDVEASCCILSGSDAIQSTASHPDLLQVPAQKQRV